MILGRTTLGARTGHIRTPRIDAKAYWDARVPMFFYNLQGFIAQEVAHELKSHHGDAQVFSKRPSRAGPTCQLGGKEIGDMSRSRCSSDPYPDSVQYNHLTEQLVWETARDKVHSALSQMGRVDFGDLVSGAIHDRDCEKGVNALVGGKPVTLKGEGKVSESGDEIKMGTQAVRLSLAEIHEAHTRGRTAKPRDVAEQLLGSDGLYDGETLVPEVLPDAQQQHPRVTWLYPDPSGLLADPEFQPALALFCSKKAADVGAISDGFDDAQKAALQVGVVDKLLSNPVGAVTEVINWTPDTGGGVGGHDTDDNAMGYYKEARKTKGGLKSLTTVQRTNLIEDLLSGTTVWGEEEESILKILRTASRNDAREVITDVGWKRVDSGLERNERRLFRSLFPEDEYGQ